MQLSWYWLVPATIVTVLFFAWIVTSGIKAQFGGFHAGIESEVGREAEVSDRITPDIEGRIFHNGEYWRAASDEILNEGDRCIIVRFEGLKVFVKSKTKQTETEELSNG